jgi:hypothetical protein
MDLIEKKYGLSSFVEVFLRLSDDLHNIFLFREYCRKMKKLRIDRFRNHSRETRFATTWWSPEEDRWESPRFDKFPYRFPWSDKVGLSDEIIELLGSEE